VWSWRNYAVNAGIGGRMASAPVTFDNKQWERQVTAAKGRTAAPGSVPLLTRKGTIPPATGSNGTCAPSWPSSPS
jgi:hypothetical protein